MNKDITDRLEKLQEDVNEIKQVMAVNTKELEIHIEGVKLAREQNDLIKRDMEERFDNLDRDIAPIKSHVAFVKGAIWAIGISGTVLFALQQMGILGKLL